jgi:hypothetical protein
MTETATTETKTPKSKKGATPKVAKTKTLKAETKAARPKKEKPPKEKLMTFAFRLTPAESAAFHKAAGAAAASRTMRALAAAFVTGDRAQFELILDEARRLQ